MSQTDTIRYIYAIQYIRSHLQTLIQTDTNKVDQELAELLVQLQVEYKIESKFQQILKPHLKARSWWVDFNQTLSGDEPVRGISGFSPADGSLQGDSAPDPLLITCAKCGFANSLFSWNDLIPCQNRDRPKHNIEL